MLWAEWNEVNILKSQLFRFKEFCEVIGWSEKTPAQNVKKKSKKSEKDVKKKADEKSDEGSSEEKEEKKGIFGFGKKKK